MKALTFTLNCIEPILISQVNTGDPNSAVGREYIPGSAIRGAIISRYLTGRTIDAETEPFRQLFLDGSVCFLNAYLLSASGQRMLPTPLSWQVEKDHKSANIYNFAFTQKDPNQITQWVGVKPFCSVWESDEGTWQAELTTPESEVKIHTFRADRQKLSKDTNNTIFRYKALSAGQKFGGVIISQEMEYLKEIKKQITGSSSLHSLNIGKSRLAGYGRVVVEDVNIVPQWVEAPRYLVEREDLICVTFLSDAIIRDSHTGFAVTTLDEIVGTQCISARSFIKPTICSGFNRTWNLPLPQVWGIQAGSVFGYLAEKGILDKLNTLADIGIGDRKAEGFGRIAIQWNLMDDIHQSSRPFRMMEHAQLQNIESLSLAQRIVNRMYRVQLDQLLIKKILQLPMQPPFPQRSQLSGMRQVLRDALQVKDPKIITNYLENLNIKALRQFKAASIQANQPLYSWIEELATNPSGVWNILDTQILKEPSISGIIPQKSGDIALEYAVRLMDGVVHKALKEGGE